MSACATCGHSVRSYDMAIGACAAPISVGSGCGICQCIRFVAVGGETAAASEPRPLTLEEIEVTVIGRIKTAFYDAGLSEEELARRATWVTNGLPKWRESASSEPGSVSDVTTHAERLRAALGWAQPLMAADGLDALDALLEENATLRAKESSMDTMLRVTEAERDEERALVVSLTEQRDRFKRGYEESMAFVPEDRAAKAEATIVQLREALSDAEFEFRQLGLVPHMHDDARIRAAEVAELAVTAALAAGVPSTPPEPQPGDFMHLPEHVEMDTDEVLGGVGDARVTAEDAEAMWANATCSHGAVAGDCTEPRCLFRPEAVEAVAKIRERGGSLLPSEATERDALVAAIATLDQLAILLDENVEEVGWQTDAHKLACEGWRAATDALAAVSSPVQATDQDEHLGVGSASVVEEG